VPDVPRCVFSFVWRGTFVGVTRSDRVFPVSHLAIAVRSAELLLLRGRLAPVRSPRISVSGQWG